MKDIMSEHLLFRIGPNLDELPNIEHCSVASGATLTHQGPTLPASQLLHFPSQILAPTPEGWERRPADAVWPLTEFSNHLCLSANPSFLMLVQSGFHCSLANSNFPSDITSDPLLARQIACSVPTITFLCYGLSCTWMRSASRFQCKGYGGK
ncbi:unnamed protein product [Nezara viridula]|uniref:Uncharacterized protein n=1 Tax=Nezara viridula TaxID=85310 RepID=A0A9P0HHT7_NEZVI|nr:unnamed protein product [Nezara viridula]